MSRRPSVAVGETYGKLTVLSESGRENGNRSWLCKCECGENTTARGYRLVNGRTSSCGCDTTRKLTASRLTHGRSRDKVYRQYHGMINRCTNPRQANYPAYGGSGVKVCQRWLTSFEHFIADMGEPPTPNHTIERRRNGLGYEPGNCYWASRLVQARNRRNMISEDMAKQIKRLLWLHTITEVSTLTNVSRGTVSDIYHGNTWTDISEF